MTGIRNSRLLWQRDRLDRAAGQSGAIVWRGLPLAISVIHRTVVFHPEYPPECVGKDLPSGIIGHIAELNGAVDQCVDMGGTDSEGTHEYFSLNVV